MAEGDFGQMDRENGYHFGHFGKDVIADTNPHTGAWYMIEMITSTTFATLTDEALKSGTQTGVAFPAGFRLFGKFTAITLTSGSCIAYCAQTWSPPA